MSIFFFFFYLQNLISCVVTLVSHYDLLSLSLSLFYYLFILFYQYETDN